MNRDRRGLLGWDPPRWRARYDEEVLALLHDQLGDCRAPLRTRLSPVGHGLADRARCSGPFVTRAEPRSLLRRDPMRALRAVDVREHRQEQALLPLLVDKA